MKKEKKYFTQEFFNDMNTFFTDSYTNNYYDIIDNTYFVKTMYISQRDILILKSLLKNKYRFFIFGQYSKLSIHIDINK